MSDKNVTERLLADAAGIARAAEILRGGGLVAVPTETVYGLAARADSDEAVAKIYAAKGRPSFNPLIVHIASIEQGKLLAEFPAVAEAVAEQAWPGALTLVLPVKPQALIADAVTAGLSTLAIRMPAHPVMQRLIKECDFPLAAPSANRSNAISPTTADHVLETLDGRIDAVIDGGECEKGLESSILAIRHDGSWEELRSGPFDLDALRNVVQGAPLALGTNGKDVIDAPGQLAKHYSPGKPLRLDAVEVEEGEFAIGFGPIAGDYSLSEVGNMEEAAARLYAALHEAAKSDKPRIAIASIPDHGIGKAINDRLRRAAA